MDKTKEYNSNGYIYRINDKGQIIHAEGDLMLRDGERNLYAQKNAGGDYRHDSDDGGHLIATRFGGSGNQDNLIAQDRYINRGAYKSLENEWAKSLEKGNDVFVEIEPIYHGDSLRPDSITAKTIVDDNSKTVVDYFSVTNENMESEEFKFPEEADDLLYSWNEEDESMAKTLVLTNESTKIPSKEQLMASGEEAIDRHMDILKDEMKNDGLNDDEIDNIISEKREESMLELKKGIYGEDKQNESNLEYNSFSEASEEVDEYRYNSNNLFENENMSNNTEYDFMKQEGIDNNYYVSDSDRQYKQSENTEENYEGNEVMQQTESSNSFDEASRLDYSQNNEYNNNLSNDVDYSREQ